ASLRHHHAVQAQLYAARDAAQPDLLAAVHYDEHDVHLGPHGRLERRAIREGIQGCGCAGVRHGGAATVADAVALHQWPDEAVLWLGFRPNWARDDDVYRLFARMCGDPHL